MGLVVVSFMVFFPYLKNGELPSVKLLMVTGPLFLLAIGGSAYFSNRKQKRQWESVIYQIEGDTITRTMSDVPPMVLKKSEITEIQETDRGGILIKTEDKLRFIGIPPQVTEREFLLSQLKELGEIISIKSKPFQTYGLLAGLATMGGFVIFATAKTPMVVATTGIPLLIVLVWAFIAIQKSNHVTKIIKRLSWISLMVILSIIGRIIFMLKDL